MYIAPMTEVQWLLAHLAEESAELAQGAMKALEYGLEAKDPANPKDTDNALDIEAEYLDINVTIKMLRDRGALPGTSPLAISNLDAVKESEKEARILLQMEVARRLGVITK